MQTTTYNLRFIARITLEAATPLAIGSGRKSILTDATINRDANGLPFIPGTTLAGLIRHAIGEETAKPLMGFIGKKQGKGNEYELEGSRLIITEAKLLDCYGKAVDGLVNVDGYEDQAKRAFLNGFKYAPIRQHAKINHHGVTEDGGKFDEEVVPKGARFCFEMELMACSEQPEVAAEEEDSFKKCLNILRAEGFRVGGKSRNGFGKIKVVDDSCLYRKLDLSKAEDLEWYLNKSASLAETWVGNGRFEWDKPKTSRYVRYELKLKPRDFLFFGSGFGDEDVDHTYIKERFITWDAPDKGRWEAAKTSLVVPASSVKGALSHRTAYHYNKLHKRFADGLSAKEMEKLVGKNNEAVIALFGSEGNNKQEGKEDDGKRRGHVLFADIVCRKAPQTTAKVYNHVKIDRFTGGGIDGALFDEEALFAKEESGVKLEILLDKDERITSDPRIIEAFEAALTDVCKGMLPLGGGVNKGYGMFEGKLLKDGEPI